LTAFHAVEPVLHQKDAPDLVCRFDYRVLPDGTAIHPGSRYRLARRDWLIDASPYDPAEMTSNDFGGGSADYLCAS
jgi:hypothetical protein